MKGGVEPQALTGLDDDYSLLQRVRRDVNSQTENQPMSKQSLAQLLKAEIAVLKARIQNIRFPNGTQENPGRTCLDIHLGHPEYKSGMSSTVSLLLCEIANLFK